MEREEIKCPYCKEPMVLVEDKDYVDYQYRSMFDIYYRCNSCCARSHNLKHPFFNFFTKYEVEDFRKRPALRIKEYERYNKSLEKAKDFVHKKAMKLQEKLKKK